jgi:choline dehydrogenase
MLSRLTNSFKMKPIGVKPIQSSYDYIIVGGGTAGCLLAKRLSEDPTKQVLLLEAGNSDRTLLTHIPAGYLKCIRNPVTDWMYSTNNEPGLNGRSISYPRGRVLGGCSSINGMIYMRGQARDYDSWANYTKDRAWAWDNCLPYFIRHERHWRHGKVDVDPNRPVKQGSGDASTSSASAVASGSGGGTTSSLADFLLKEYHGANGELCVVKQRLKWDILDRIKEAAVEAGIPAVEDFNLGNNEGVAYFEVNQRHGLRWSCSRAFLPLDVQRRPNLSIHLNANVRKLKFDDHYNLQGQLVCLGVEVDLPNGRTETLTVNPEQGGEVILSAGSIGSPKILQLSGIGPVDILAKADVPIKLPLPVGENLHDHLQLRTIYKVKDLPTLNTMYHSWIGCIKIGLDYAMNRSGPLAMAPSQLGAFVKSNPDRADANLEFHIQPLSLDAFGKPLHRHDAVTLSVCNLNPTSRGTVAIQSRDPYRMPSIQPNYLATEEDRQVAVEAIRAARRVASQPALKPYIIEEQLPGAAVQTEAELVRAAGDIGTSIFHPAGTCKMGPVEDESTVVNSRLCVKGVQGLRVVDCSVMPTITSGNTNAPVLMIAEKAAEWIKEKVFEAPSTQ